MIAFWNSLLETAAGWSTAAIVIRLVFALLVGIVIGVDREMKNRGAGIKTHVLVCIGSAVVMLMAEYISFQFPEAKADMNRYGAAVISGIGFLGVGTILVTGKMQVRGLTTAAGLWASACVGLAAGIGFIKGTVIALIFIVFTLKVLDVVDQYIHKYARDFEVYIEFTDSKSIRLFIDEMHAKGIRIKSFELTQSEIRQGGPAALVRVLVDTVKERPEFIESLNKLEYVSYAEEL